MSSSEFSVYPRDWVSNPQSAGGVPDFTLLTYNILADKHIPSDAYQYCPADVRYMKHRHKHVLAEIQQYGGDIVCFQEVEESNFDENLKPWFESQGFTGCMMNRSFGSGQATFYNTAMFDLLNTEKVKLVDAETKYLKNLNLSPEEEENIPNLINAGNTVILSTLKHKATGRILYLGNIHVLWGDLKYPGVQLMEVITAVNELYRIADSNEAAVILCGDFNSPPYWPPYLAMQDGKLNDEAMETLRKEPRSRSSKDSYVMGTEPEITNCDDGAQDYITELCLDYLWYNPCSLEVTNVLKAPPAGDIKKYTALPSVLFPSDHIPLWASYKFK